MNDRIEIKNIPVDVEVHKPDPSKQGGYSPESHIYVRSVKGTFQRLRRYMGAVFMLLFMITPWIQYQGHQAILFDIEQQKFHLFALTLWPQDLLVVAFIFMIAAFALFFVTAFYGRVWCGYMCPQTVWTLIYIWMEEKIEGTANQRKLLDKQPWTAKKVMLKTAKHSAWIAFSVFTALTFVGYFTPIGQLFIDFFMLSASAAATVSVWFFAACTYGNAGWMREIMCLHICPYSRFQSAMFDKDTFTVTYDYHRGESRGPRSRKQDHKALGLGDCIDCNLCVQVCPTGIDIRNGLQYECINCGLCIDACDGVMDKMGYPKGLIKYSTEHELEGKKTKTVRMKFLGYLAMMLIMCGALAWSIAARVPFELDIIRDRNQLYRVTSEGLIENVYTLKLLNKSQQDVTVTLDVTGLSKFDFIGRQRVEIQAGEVFTLPVSVAVDPYELKSPITEIYFVVTQEGGESFSIKQDSRFIKGKG
ncbi:cytochrome c oxidase accessory protein CcoG [Flocculibacter collagenilyticus]|uniref:cytochrome c oxidase accessory protein CcoG n=1 Tax=Flocculibacter collagenilyticus TaxID=2744479 RepID=UPI0018F3DCF7|nr:cytochrome c oxidase accessory protein CcoG [Flocculibacter collagenilyticus]